MDANTKIDNHFDVVIVGCGPAGSSAALQLIRYGIRVAIIEKACMPRYKPCGGGIVYKALKYIPVDISPVVEKRCLSVLLGMVSVKKKFIIKRDYPIITMTMRDKMDQLLANAALSAGVKIFQDCKLEDILFKKKLVLVTNRGNIIADFVIGADGVISTAARKAGWKETRTLVPSVNWEVFVEEKELKRFDGVARFDFGFFLGDMLGFFLKKIIYPLVY